jgi:DnaJ-class molecular chaperone
VNIKPGWKKGTKITFPGEGDEAPGMLPADVIFVLVQHPHDHFVREGSDLVFTARVSLADALADCIIEIPTLDGRILSLPCPEVSFSFILLCRLISSTGSFETCRLSVPNTRSA